MDSSYEKFKEEFWDEKDWLTNCHDDELNETEESINKPTHIGPPVSTENSPLTQEELEDKGMVGIYEGRFSPV